MINSLNVSGVTGSGAVTTNERATVGVSSKDQTKPINPTNESSQQTSASKKQVEEATEKVKNFVQNINRDLNFSIDQDTEQLVVKVIDSGTREVIRQIPSEEMLNIAKTLDKIQGLFVQQKA